MLRSEVRPAKYCLYIISIYSTSSSFISVLLKPFSPQMVNYISYYYKRKYKIWDIFCCSFNFFHSVSQEGLNPRFFQVVSCMYLMSYVY